MELEKETNIVKENKPKKSKENQTKVLNSNKQLFKYFCWSLVKNRFFIVLFSVLTITPILTNALIQILISHSASPNIAANENMIFIIVSSVISFMCISLSATFLLFVNSKNNGSLLYLYTLNYDRKFLYKMRLLIVAFVTTISISIIFVSNIIMNSSFNHLSNWFFVAIYLVSILFLIFISVIFALYSYFLKAIPFVTFSILTIVASIALFFAGISSISKSSNKLEFNSGINQNNYSKLFLVDKNGNEKRDYIVVNKNFANSINASSNIENAFQNDENSILRNFSLLNIFSQATSSIENVFAGETKYTQDELNKISNGANYWHNFNLFGLKKYKNGDPDQIKDEGLKKVFISFQDQSPFELSYDDIFNKISQIVTQNNLTKKQILLDSISAKTNSEDYWSTQNTNFSDGELSILKDFSGVEDNHWLFYMHYYYSLIKNKVSKLETDLSKKFGAKIGAFIWNIFNGEKYNNNLIKFNTIYSNEKIQSRFPMIGALDENENADLADITFFKKELIHSVTDSTHTTFKILEKDGKGYVPINLGSLKIKTKADWEKYIDNNAEVINLKNLYSELFKIDNNIMPKYEFSDNTDDIYQINRVVNIVQKPWINNIWIHLLAILLSTVSIAVFTNRISFKKEGKHVE